MTDPDTGWHEGRAHARRRGSHSTVDGLDYGALRVADGGKHDVTEASARASLYLMTLSSSLVAIGFTFGSAAFAPLVSTITPVIVLLGIFTIVRLVDTGVGNVASLTGIARIRSFYRTLGPTAAVYFPSAGDSDDEALSRITANHKPKPDPSKVDGY